MTTEQSDPNTKKANNENDDASIKPDPETLHTTDPQEHMKGPISSMVHGVEETMEGESDEDEPKKEKE